jgi:hypothetical protein
MCSANLSEHCRTSVWEKNGKMKKKRLPTAQHSG